jgi:hypothetical protein
MHLNCRSVGVALLVGLSWASVRTAEAQTCGFPAGGTLTTAVNTYYAGVGTAAAGNMTLNVDTASVRGGPAIAAGDMLIVMQMQQAQFHNSNNNNYGSNTGTGNGYTALNSTGLYEYVVATAAVTGAGALAFVGGSAATSGLINTYTTAASVAGQGQQTFQVIRVPQYGSATLGAGLTALPWNGRTGGVLAIDVSGTLALGTATVSVDGLGFRGATGEQLQGDGGVTNNTDYRVTVGDHAHGVKGEGIAGTPSQMTGVAGGVANGYPGGDRARGAPGTAGGGGSEGNPNNNDQNTGGGGGGNGGVGGTGGSGWPGGNGCPPNQGSQTGGVGGAAFGAAAVTQISLGGGGGAGTRNNNGPSSGGAGGGIVMIRAGQTSGTGTITARGLRPLSTANDGAGGGGAGGTVLVATALGNLSGLTVDVSGGQGGYANLPSPPAPDPPPAGVGGVHHGPGGGGAGGVILVSSALAASNISGGSNGFTNTCDGDSIQIAYDATPGTNGVLQTNITLAQIPGVQPCTLATRATIRGLRINPSGLVEFATSSQRKTLAFNIYGTDDATGRGSHVLLNRKPIAAPVPSSTNPILYKAETDPISTSFVMIEEIEAGGHSRMSGPYPVGAAHLRTAFEQVEALAATMESHMKAGAQMVSLRKRGMSPPVRLPRPGHALPSGEALKIEVSQAGPVQVPLTQLVAQGMPMWVLSSPGKMRLTNLGKPVPFQVTNGALAFQAELLSTDYTGENVYVVSWGSPTPAPLVTLTRSGFPPIPGSVRVEQQNFYVPFDAEGADPWVWDLLVSGQAATNYTFDIPNLQAGPNPVPVRIGLVGGAPFLHTVTASLNGTSVGTLTFQGEVQASLTGTLPAGLLLAHGNQLTLTYTASGMGPTDVGILFFDLIDLGVGVAPPTNPVPVDLIEPYEPQVPTGTTADYLIVTHSLFEEQALRIANLKQAEGHRTLIVDVERAYDRFSSGVFDAASVKAMIAAIAWKTPVHYVLLIGDDTFDPRNFTGSSPLSYIPSLNAFDGMFGRVPSENRYADLRGDGAPELAIGRLPVQTTDEANMLADKIAGQEAVLKGAGQRELIALDTQGAEDISFSGEAAALVAALPAGSTVTYADLSKGLDQARQNLLTGLGEGPLATHYFGHGGQEMWANAGLLTKSDAQGLPQNGHETVLFTWTCETQWYQYQFRPVINEALLLVPNGGALATVGPSGITDPKLQAPFFLKVYDHFFKGVSLGESIRLAKGEALRQNRQSQTVVDGWNLLGDPALRLVK